MELEGHGDIDPEIAARHQAVYDDLMNEIDGLDSDSDGEQGSKPQSKPVSKPKQNVPAASNTKKYKIEPKDDFDFGQGGGDDFAQLQAGLGAAAKNKEIEDLEKELAGLDSDGDDGGDAGGADDDDDADFVSPANKHSLPNTTQEKKPIGTSGQKPAPVQNPAQVLGGMAQKAATGNVASSGGSVKAGTGSKGGAGFPLKHFTGHEAKKLIAIDNKYHGKDVIRTKGLIDYEIKEVINPCLAASSVSAEVKAHLEAKKKSLESFRQNIDSLFKSGKLNAGTYMKIISQMKDANIKIAKELTEAKVGSETDRVRERLKILVDEEKIYLGQSGGSAGQPKSTTTSQKSGTSQKEESKTSSLADSLKVSEDKSSKVSGSEIDKMDPDELLVLLKKRKDQYWNLANYINKELLKHLDGNEANLKKADLQGRLIPLIQKSGKLLEGLENGEGSREVASFLKRELHEVSPETLHGKSLQDREHDLDELKQKLQVCLDEETAYTDKLRATLAGDQASALAGKKVKEGEQIIKKYNEYIDLLGKLNAEKFKWVPTPKVNIVKDQRTVQLLNQDIPGSSMLVKFLNLEHITPRTYWIRWSVESINGTVSHDTPYCDQHSLRFNYQQMVQMSTKDKIDQSIENKVIKIEVLFKKMFFEKKKCEGTIPLNSFRKSNTVEGKVKLRDDGIVLNYVLKVREPLLKHIKTEIPMIQSFHIFPPFNRDAPVPVAQPTQPKPAQPKPVQEERKAQEPAKPAAAGGLFEKKKYPPLVLLKQQNDPLASLGAGDVPGGLPLELVLDPANPDIIDCLAVLKKLAEELEKARPMLAAEGRRADNKIVGDNWTKALKKATILETKFGEGDIDPNQYLEILSGSIARDKILLEFYRSKGDGDRLAFIAEKMKLTIQEKKELEEALAAGGEEEA